MAIVIDKDKFRKKLINTYGGYEDNTHHNRIFWIINDVEYGGVDIRHSSKNTIPQCDYKFLKRKLNLKSTQELKDVEVCCFGKERLIERLITRPPLGL